MGQEASMPHHAGPLGELDADNEPSNSSNHSEGTMMTASSSTGGKKRPGARMMGVLRGNSNNNNNNHHHHHHAAAAATTTTANHHHEVARSGNLYDEEYDDALAPPVAAGLDGGHAASDATWRGTTTSAAAAAASASSMPPPSQQQQQQNTNHNNSHHRTPMGGLFEKKKSGGGGGNSSGRTLMNSMRNLTLRGSKKAASTSALTSTNTNATATAAAANDWETNWDNDSSDSSSSSDPDDEIHDDAAAGLAPAAAATAAAHLPAPHSPIAAGRTAVPAVPVSPPRITVPYPNAHSPKAAVSSSTTTTSSSSSPPPRIVSSPPSSPLPAQPPVVIENDDAANDDDGMEWDTATGAASAEGDDGKPKVEMFLPMLRVLGKGSFGKVVLVQKRVGKERGQLFAMKILRKTYLVKRRQIERTRTERKVLSVVNHPFIMKLHYAFQTEEKLYLVLDYCPGGELFFHLSRFRRFPERVARFYAAELLLAIGHLHKRGIIYRDLKPENVLLDADGHVKLGDFGLAKSGIQHPWEGASSMCGTPEYMAPEVLSQQGHGFGVDYWGLGMLVYEMMTGLPPWYTTDRAKLFRRLKSAPLDIPNYFTGPSANCVSALLERSPKRRLGVTGIRTAMEHDFFRSINWKALYARRVEAPIRPCEGWKAPEAVPDDTGGTDQQQPQHPLHGGSGESKPLHQQQNGGPPINGQAFEMLDSHELEAATANFDNTFTRMPVESEDQPQQQQDGSAPIDGEELNEHTFVGFTFDGGPPPLDRPPDPRRQRAHPITSSAAATANPAPPPTVSPMPPIH